MSPARTLSRALRTVLLTLLAITLLTATFFVGVAPSAAAPTFTLSLSSPGPGTIYAIPVGSQLPAGTAVQLTADADINGIFLGWTIDGTPRGWAEKITVMMNEDHTVVANFVTATDFTDIYAGSYYNAAIDELAARGIIKGYGDGRVGPRDGTLRAQMAALITRAIGWDGEDHGNPFSDQGTVDSDLWRNVGTLAHYDVAKGYGDGSYGPTDPVLRVQVIAFISRAMVAKGYWVQQPDDPALFTNVPASSGHRQDLATYARYVKYLPNTSDNATFADWDAPSIRGWFAAALWGALDSHFGVTIVID